MKPQEKRGTVFRLDPSAERVALSRLACVKLFSFCPPPKPKSAAPANKVGSAGRGSWSNPDPGGVHHPRQSPNAATAEIRRELQDQGQPAETRQGAVKPLVLPTLDSTESGIHRPVGGGETCASCRSSCSATISDENRYRSSSRVGLCWNHGWGALPVHASRRKRGGNVSTPFDELRRFSSRASLFTSSIV